jgi:S-adenosylmethionine decarboxylase
VSPESGDPLPPATGTEWIVEARGCRPEALRSEAALRALFERAVAELGLRPVAPAVFHLFPPPGGVTGVLLLSESHLTCHTFPESGYAALNLYCCRPRVAWDFPSRCAEILGASRTDVRAVRRGGLPGPR